MLFPNGLISDGIYQRQLLLRDYFPLFNGSAYAHGTEVTVSVLRTPKLHSGRVSATLLTRPFLSLVTVGLLASNGSLVISSEVKLQANLQSVNHYPYPDAQIPSS